jgi:hypothetical protein
MERSGYGEKIIEKGYLMIQLSNDGVFRSTLLDNFPKIAHGFTTRQFGNMNAVETRELFMKNHNIHPDLSVSQKQIHGSVIHTVTPDEFGKVVLNSDGILYKNENTTKHPILIVRVGDCVPLLFFDPKTQIIGVAHAGWKGTVRHIAKEMIRAFIGSGADAGNILVLMGPSICQKCYEVSDDVAIQFQKEFPNNKTQSKVEQKWHVDLVEANYQDCKDLHIDNAHIDCNKTLCTYEKKELFYSWRRKTEPFGEIMGYIGYTG